MKLYEILSEEQLLETFDEQLLEYQMDKYTTDPSTGLKLNQPNQWSQSPYLYAVKSKSGKYNAQIHIPQSIWSSMVQGKAHKWSSAPQSFFSQDGKLRNTMLVGPFQDPRRAAWLAQTILFSDRAEDYIEDYFDEKYNDGDGSIWRSLLKEIPQFDGAPLEEKDKEEFFASISNKELDTKKQKYEETMTKKLRQALFDFYDKNKALAKKRLPNYTGSRNQLMGVIDKLIADKGLDYFLTSPNSVKFKDIASLTF